jgi:methylenetetrahydrofolate dehydrogenase (NADP+) / methenyltetrahydrofolate cyclohydrolase
MMISGLKISDDILNNLRIKTANLAKTGLIKTLAIIIIGNDPASLSYIKQKIKAADKINIKYIIYSLPLDTKSKELKTLIDKLNIDPLISGIIIQRPVPIPIKQSDILEFVNPQKDVDGFVKNTNFTVPVVKAIQKILINIYNLLQLDDNNFNNWLNTKNVVIIGRGETAGKPIYNYLKNCTTSISNLHSKIINPDKFIKKADIIISCVGKPNIITSHNIKKNVILIGVGLHKNDENRIIGDYNEEEIKDIASFYTPTPGGVGPVNVASLMENLVNST